MDLEGEDTEGEAWVAVDPETEIGSTARYLWPAVVLRDVEMLQAHILRHALENQHQSSGPQGIRAHFQDLVRMSITSLQGEPFDDSLSPAKMCFVAASCQEQQPLETWCLLSFRRFDRFQLHLVQVL